MPELIEIEVYRRAAERAVGRTVATVDAPDSWWLKGGLTAPEVVAAVEGREITGARRIGKLLMLDLDGGETVLGLRFGMTGRLLVDGEQAIDRLEYSSHRLDPAWDRFTLHFEEGGTLRVSDPRRLGGASLDPDESALGVDALQVTPAQLRAALGPSASPLKARLLDQSRVAGLGNLLVDEILWRAGLDPTRSASSLTPAEMRRLHRQLRGGVQELLERGGSHTGDLQAQRHRGGRCPKDGTELSRRTVGGRTTYSCPTHQH